MDVYCKLCAEPWDSYCQHDGTMAEGHPDETGFETTAQIKALGRKAWREFLQGKGCPACKWGARRPSKAPKLSMWKLLEQDAATEGDNEAQAALFLALKRGDLEVEE